MPANPRVKGVILPPSAPPAPEPAVVYQDGTAMLPAALRGGARLVPCEARP